MRHAVMMAGGSGTRLWPLSRQSKPKQLLHIFEGQSLLRQTYDRLRSVFPAEHIYVITGSSYVAAMSAELPEMPAGNFLAEPCARDTANAVGLAAHLLATTDPQGTMGIFTADHIIKPREIFRETVLKGFDVAERFSDALVTFGLKPRSAHTGYGYMHRGTKLLTGVYAIQDVKEKPDALTARRYCESGEYYWNSGMFVWRLPAILAQFQKHQPQMDAAWREVAAGFRDPGRADAVLARFAALPRISIDFAIMEKADRVIAVEMPCEWLDLGSWPALAEVLAPDGSGNIFAAPNVMTLDAGNNICVSESDHLIAAIGVHDLVIVHADDATLICPRDQAQRIKEMLERVRSAHGDRYV